MKRSLAALAWLVVAAASASSCSLGEGEGEVKSDRLVVGGCWTGPFDLGPDFFAAVPYRDTLQIRVQRGGDLEENSDGLLALVDDIGFVRAHLDEPIEVGLSPAVTAPGVPVTADPDPPKVHLTLYLHESCHAQNSALYAVAGTITFHAIFNGDPNETNASEKLTDAEFADVTFADPRDLATPGSAEIDPAKASHVRGRFRFYFQRGQPGQPFP